VHKSALESWLFRALFVQDVYAAKGSKTFWLYSIGYYKKWGNSKKYCIL